MKRETYKRWVAHVKDGRVTRVAFWMEIDENRSMNVGGPGRESEILVTAIDELDAYNKVRKWLKRERQENG